MKRYLLIGALLILLLACCPCGSLLSVIDDIPQITDPVVTGQMTEPDFTLESMDGTWVTLSGLQGQIVVLDFWATWCPPCMEGLPHLQEIHDRYADEGVVVLAINLEESRDDIERRLDDDYTFTILMDSDGSVSNDYNVWAIPHTIVIDQSGVGQEIPMGPMGVESVIQDLLP